MKTLHEEPGTSSRPRKSQHLLRALRPQEREALRAALHDGLGQALTSISFLAGSLQQKLTAQNLPEASDAAEIASLISRAVSETQALVHEPNASAFQ
jgi:signal transduction histidine kinase